jgi:hypothetical protein
MLLVRSRGMTIFIRESTGDGDEDDGVDFFRFP